ncbi:hypothetical protein Gotri_020422, partial [Gossypium trilobum]|nr:hypothetical protein [Gossypium trilobum]
MSASGSASGLKLICRFGVYIEAHRWSDCTNRESLSSP